MNRWANQTRNLIAAAFAVGLLLVASPASGIVLQAAAWAMVVFLAELLWHRARDGRLFITMAPAAHVPCVAMLAGPWGLAANVLGSLLGSLLGRRHSPARSLAYTGAVLLGSGAALAVLSVTRVPDPVSGIPGLVHLFRFAAAGLVYSAVVQVTLAAITCRERGLSWLGAWRETYGDSTEIVTATALLLVAMLVFVAHSALGFGGLLLCAMPLLFLQDGSRRYLQLERAQTRIIETERLAAKGEMAAEIGHELNNYLAAISGRAQLLCMSRHAEEDETLEQRVNTIRDLSMRMSGLAKGLMDFSHRESRRATLPVTTVLEKTLELVRPQAKFQDVRFEIREHGPATPVDMDAGQVQHALLTLLGRASQNSRTQGQTADLSIRAGSDGEGTVSILIGARDLQEEELELLPQKRRSGRAGSDPELLAVKRIVELQKGRFSALQDSQEREVYRIELPAA